MSRARTIDAIRRVEDMLIEEGDPIAIYLCHLLLLKVASQMVAPPPASVDERRDVSHQAS